MPSRLSGVDGATSIKEEIVARMPEINDAAQFRKARYILWELGGAAALGEELVHSGFLDPDDFKLKVQERPSNIFPRIASGVQSQPSVVQDQLALGEYAKKFVICHNRPENDLHWDTHDKDIVRKVSMARKHRFLTTKDLSWEWFNALVFGLVPEELGGTGLQAALEEVEAMKAAAQQWAANTPGWSEQVGLFFNVFGHNDVNSLFMHILDMKEVGPSFKLQAFKNLHVDEVLKVLREELEAEAAAAAASGSEGGGGVGGRGHDEFIAVYSVHTKASMMSRGRMNSFQATDGATSVKSELVGRVPMLKDAGSYREARRLLQEELGTYVAVREELTRAGFIDTETGGLTTGGRPFNVFARLAAGAMQQPWLDREQEALGDFAGKFLVCSNLPENDSHWDSEDPDWVGKASMSPRHRFLTKRDLHWSWFNALTFGLVPPSEGGADKAVVLAELEEMKSAALHFARHAGGWSEEVGLFFHVFGHNSVNSLHLHVVDLQEVGPSYHKQCYKNCPLDAVLKVISEERAAEGASLLLRSRLSVAPQQAAPAAAAAIAKRVSIQGAYPVGQERRAFAREVLELNVGGRVLSVAKETMLMAPAGSLLRTMFQPGTAGAAGPLAWDLEGRLYLDYPPGPFERIVNHLRLLRQAPAHVEVRAPTLRGDELEETLALAQILGVEALLPQLRARCPWCARRRPRPPQQPQGPAEERPRAAAETGPAEGGHARSGGMVSL